MSYGGCLVTRQGTEAGGFHVNDFRKMKRITARGDTFPLAGEMRLMDGWWDGRQWVFDVPAGLFWKRAMASFMNTTAGMGVQWRVEP